MSFGGVAYQSTIYGRARIPARDAAASQLENSLVQTLGALLLDEQAETPGRSGATGNANAGHYETGSEAIFSNAA